MTESKSIQSAQFVRQQLLVGLDVGFGALEVEVQQHAGKALDDLFERHDAEVAVRRRLAALDVLLGLATGRHRRARDPPVRVVHLAQLGQREIGDRAVVIRRAIDGLVVTDHDVAIGRRVDVEFDRGRALGEGVLRSRPTSRTVPRRSHPGARRRSPGVRARDCSLRGQSVRVEPQSHAVLEVERDARQEPGEQHQEQATPGAGGTSAPC